MEIVIVVVALVCAVAVIAAPFRGNRAVAEAPPGSAERAELEAAKEAKYREIREAELDYRTGKMSEEDWRAVDSSLRAEAVELLRGLDSFGKSA
jgi:hypothetical protein